MYIKHQPQRDDYHYCGIQMRTTILSLMVALGMSAQTTVYLRSSAPAAVPISSLAAGTPGVITTSAAHGFSVGNVVIVAGLCGSDGSVTGQSAANGIVKVYSVPTSTSFGIETLAGAPITTTASVNCDPVSYSPGAAWTGLLTAHTLGTGPLGWLDGLNGPNYRKLALSTANGLTSLTVASNVATVTTSYNHGVSNGDYIAVWNSGTSALDQNGGNGCGMPPCPVAAYQAMNVTATTFQFATSGVSNGTYSGVNNHCGPASPPNSTIGGTQDCLVISQLAYQGNPFWDAVNYYSGNNSTQIFSGTGYKYVIDGGLRFPDEASQGLAQDSLAAPRFLVDRTNTQMFNVLYYGIMNMYKMFGVNWTLDESQPGGGGYQLGANETTGGSAMLYSVIWPYLSSSDLSFVNNEIYNDLDDPTVPACNKAANDFSTGHNKVLTRGTAQAGSATTITLASGTTSSEVPVNTIIDATVGGNDSFGLVTAFSGSGGSSPQATVASWSNGSPSNGTAYIVYATISISSTAGGGTAVVTGYGTTFVSDGVSAGDAVFGGALQNVVELAESFVTSVTSNTSLAVINSEYPNTTAAPQIYRYIPHFDAATSCGMFWMDEHWMGYPGAQPLLYPPRGGDLTLTNDGPIAGSNNATKYGAQWTILGLVSANDPRAVRKLARSESYGFDWSIAHYMNYTTGIVHSGAYYSFVNVLPASEAFAAALNLSVPTFPSLDVTNSSGWMQTPSLYKMFSVLPDFRFDPGYGIRTGWPSRFGSEDSVVSIDYALGGQWVNDGALLWAPTSNNAKWLRNWLATSQSKSLWSFWGTSAGPAAWDLIQNDPRIVSSDFTVQPHQYLFQSTSAATCATLTGWTCPANFRADVVISRTGWSRYNDTATAGPSATYLYYGSRVFAGDHDAPQNGTMLVYKVGELLATDFNPPNDEYASNGSDQTAMGFMLQLGGSSRTLNINPSGTLGGYSPIIRWASANHGSWPSAYGDQNSNYAYACSDLSGVYTVASNYIQRCIAHLKQSGSDEFVLQWDTASLTSAISGGIATHIHYSQIPGAATAYPPGTTAFTSGTFSGGVYSGGVVELESGTADTYGDPTPNFGLATRFLSPGTISITGDGNTYSGNSGACNGSGCSYRVSVCAGSSCGSAASTFESLVVHRVLPSRTDQALNCPSTWTQTNWFIAQCAGTNTAMVVALARGGTTYSSMSGFTTTHSGTAQYLFGGLSAGTYTVTVNGSQVSGSPFTVGSGDGSIEFLSTAGTVSFNGSAAPCSITTTSLPGGTIGSSYSQAVSTANCTAPISWSVSSGSLCAGLNLGPSTGVISGVPSIAQTCSFTAQAVDAVPTTATEPLSITIAGGGSTTVASFISGHTTASGDVIVH